MMTSRSKCKKAFAFLLLICTLLSSCNASPLPPNTQEDESSTPPPSAESDLLEESTDETEDPTDENVTAPPSVIAALPDEQPEATFPSGDGMETARYAEQTEADFHAACAYMEQNGYLRYCERDTKNTLSATYVKGNAYSTLFYSKIWKKLTLGFADDGGQNYPKQNQPYQKVCDTAITQPGLSGEGMCEIFRLADGSFLIFDSGTSSAAPEIYRELCRLNGSDDIHVRAWVLTHSHSDHYGGFVSYVSEAKYRNHTQIDYLLYAPINRAVADQLLSYNTSWDGIDYYFNTSFLTLVRNILPNTKLCSVHAGQVFTFADVELQILYTSEYLYIDGVPINFNNTSIISRVENAEGSVLLMGDSGENATDWALSMYDEELRSDMMQVTHHGMVTNYDLKMMNKAKATTYFWPCGEDKFNLYWGLNCTAKQHAITTAENLIHGYGSATRKLSYRGTRPLGTEFLKEGTLVHYVGVEQKTHPLYPSAISFTVTDPNEHYVTLLTAINTSEYNALRITLSCPDLKSASLSFTSGLQTPFDFTAKNTKKLGPQGLGRSGTVSLLVYLGNGESYYGNLSSLKLNLGEAVGDTVTVHSIEGIYIDLD